MTGTRTTPAIIRTEKQVMAINGKPPFRGGRGAIDEAARHVPPERLCLSPQCGFSSTVHGNEITEAEEIAKLRLVVETAEDVWG